MSHEDMEKLRRAIELRLKLGKLDSLLLFVPTLLGLAFSLLQYSLGMIKQLIDIVFLVPVLLFGVGAPIYIGYYRGGIKLDSITERARGWIYLLLGLSLYLFSVLRIALETWLPNLQWVVRVLAFFVPAIIGYFSSGIGPGILSLFDRKPSQSDKDDFRATAFAAMVLAVSFIIAVDHLRSMAMGKVELLTAVTYVASWTMFLQIAVTLELSARKTILEGLGSPRAAVKSALALFGSIPLLLIVASLDNISRLFPNSSEILLAISFVLLGAYVTVTVILLRKEIRRSSIVRRREI